MDVVAKAALDRDRALQDAVRWTVIGIHALSADASSRARALAAQFTRLAVCEHAFLVTYRPSPATCALCKRNPVTPRPFTVIWSLRDLGNSWMCHECRVSDDAPADHVGAGL